MKTFEQYQDMIARLYPELVSKNDGEKTLSRTITFQVCDECNLCCKYCYQINKGKRRMKFEDAKKLIDMLLSGDKRLGGYVDVSTSPAIIIEFIGGEPFMNIELIEQICDYFVKRTIELCHPWATMYSFSICSNGVLYFDPRVQHFLNKYKGRVSFSVTIDGNKELHDACRVFPDGSGSYDMAVAAAKDWMSRGYYMGSKITIAPQNLDYLCDAVFHMVDLGYEEINANVVYEKGWTLDDAKKYYKQLKRLADFWVNNNLVDTHYLALFVETFFKPKKEDDLENWCGGTGFMLAMDPDGFLYPCIRYMESSLGDDRSPLRIGHVDEGIGQTECTHNCIECLNNINRRSQSTDECFYCPIAEGCSWCFKAGTMIRTPNGDVAIEKLKVGDSVLDENGNEQLVENVMKRMCEKDEALKVRIGKTTTYTTKNHPYLTVIGGKTKYIPINDIPEGSFIATREEDGELTLRLLHRKEAVSPYEVYNLTVTNTHSYIANSAIVHNCSAYNYQMNGTPDSRCTFICDMHKARALANVYFWNKWYQKKGLRKVFKNNVPDEWALTIIDEDELKMLKELEEERNENCIC